MLRAAAEDSCGLMQESKDIQHLGDFKIRSGSCGLMQESKDIQPDFSDSQVGGSCGLMQESKDIQQQNRLDSFHKVVV